MIRLFKYVSFHILNIMKDTKAMIFSSYLKMTLGILVYVFGLSAFLIPGQIVGGGLSGLAMILYYATNIPVGVSYFAMNGLLFILAVRILGASFGVKAIYGMVLSSVLLTFLPNFFKTPLVPDPFMVTTVGSVLCGAGIGIIIAAGGSTGGTELIALLINNFRNISPGRIMLVCDVLIISGSFLAFQSLEKLMYGYVAMVILSFGVDMYLEGARQSVQITLFSKEWKTIAQRIETDINRGLTILKGTGWYSKEDVFPIMIVARRQELSGIMRIVKECDEHAFVSVAKVMGVFGQGFDRIKF